MKYRVTAYSLQSTWALKNNVMTLVRRWTRVNSWDCDKKSHALRILRVWTNYNQPFFKATLQSIKKGGKKRVKR